MVGFSKARLFHMKTNQKSFFNKSIAEKKPDMKKLILKFCLLLISLPIATCVFGQIAHFPFNTNFDDVLNGYAPTTFGNPSIISDEGHQVLQLEGDEYLSLPNGLHEHIDPNQNVEVQLRFKITDTYDDSPYPGTGQFGRNGKRIIISNKDNGIYSLGFDIYVEEMDEEYRILMSFGDNTSTGGTFIFNDLIEENTWIDFKLILRVNDPRPSIVYKMNGYYHHFPLNALDAELFKQSLNTQQLWVGTDSENLQGFEGYAFAEMSIDYIKIFNPPFVGNSTLVASALTMMNNHINGTNVLSEDEQKTQLTIIVDNWDDTIYEAISEDILNYITTYEQEEGTVYQFYTEYIDPKEVAIPRALQFFLIQYFIDNLYTNDHVATMSGISFLDHQIFPGEVSNTAPRTNGTVVIDGDYTTNPGYYLSQQEFVIRPTGYYAAPGEIVDITFPATLINQGAKVHVGAHFVDIREDYRGFQRFPNMSTKFEINNATISVANPFGGAIYIILQDGSNFGSVSIQINKAIKSPYYSNKTGFSNSLSAYQSDLANAHVNWVDIESNNFMCTFPRAIAQMSPDANALLIPFNSMMEQFNVFAGRPLTRIRSEYVVIEPQSYTQGTLPASYPMSIINGDLNEMDPFAIPVSVLDPQIHMNIYDGTTIFHELGHLHNFPTMYDEVETNINAATIIAFSEGFDVSIDTALYHNSGHQNLYGDESALDWILDPRFRKFQGTTYEEVSYQHRGVAKYADVARLFSWDSVGLIHNYWYQEMLNSGEIADGMPIVSPDEYIEVASDQLGFNFAPLWEFWGNIPTQDLVDHLDTYQKENRIKNRILHYRTLVPNNAAEFLTIYNAIAPNIEEHHKERYDEMLSYYDESVADSIFQRIDDILCKYFDVNCLSLPIELIDFVATKRIDHVQLDWQTAMEDNNVRFDIERAPDGHKFDLIGSVPGANNSAVVSEYTSYDRSPLNGTNYYRLKQVDFDGKFEYSDVEIVNFTNSEIFKVYPIPTSQNIYIQSNQDYNSIEIVDLLGRLIYQRAEKVSEVDLSTIDQGIYYLKLLDSNKSQIAIKKIMVIR